MVSDDHNWELDFKPCRYSDQLLNKIALLNKTATRSVDLTEVKKAIHYAKVYHGTQIRESGEPYYTHPIAVAGMVAEHTALENKKYFRTDMLVTSILHDTLEDTVLTKDIIESIFGTQVANQVQDLTRVKDGYKISSAEMLRLLWLQKKYDVLLIKLFDRLHNALSLRVKSHEKIKKIVMETLEEFVIFAMYFQIPELSQKLIDLCYQHLPLKHSLLQD